MRRSRGTIHSRVQRIWLRVWAANRSWFFVLSGYLVGGSVLRSVRTGSWSWRAYLLGRLSRLYVVLLPALLLGGALDWLGMHMAGTEAVYSGNSGMHALVINVHDVLTWPILAANGLFL